MGRNIVLPRVAGVLESKDDQSNKPDNYASKIVKLIPADIIGVYLGLQSLFSGLDKKSLAITQLVIFFVILIISFPYLRIVTGLTDRKQRAISIISYCVWCISLGGPFAYFLLKVETSVSAEQIGGALLMLYTLIVPMLYTGTINVNKTS